MLERIADATGGRAFFPFQIRDVANAFAEIQDELRSQYAVSYKPADFKADGHYRTIEIVANDRKNLQCPLAPRLLRSGPVAFHAAYHVHEVNSRLVDLMSLGWRPYSMTSCPDYSGTPLPEETGHQRWAFACSDR